LLFFLVGLKQNVFASGTNLQIGAWQKFDEIFLSGYNALKKYNKPIMLAEVSSAEVGGDKAKWITDSFSTIKASYDKIFAIMWFNEKKETDWLINSSPEMVIWDLNGDGKINIFDMIKLKHIYQDK